MDQVPQILVILTSDMIFAQNCSFFLIGIENDLFLKSFKGLLMISLTLGAMGARQRHRKLVEGLYVEGAA